MASLSGQNPSSTFPSLIKTINNNPVSGTLIQLSDGNGTAIPISVSTSSVQITGALTASIVAATNNGNGTNFKVGDDLWIGDVNISNTAQVMGAQDNTKGYIKFGKIVNAPILGASSGSILELTGSLSVSGSIQGSIATSSYAVSSSQAVSSSYALTASYASNVPLTSSYALTASQAVSSSYALSSSQAVSSSYTLTASYAVTSSIPLLGIITASTLGSTITFTKGDSTTFNLVLSQTGSIESASYALYAVTASYVENAQTASYITLAQTASYVETAQTASYTLNAVSSSYVTLAQTASYVENAQTASIAISSSYSINADTASYVENAISSSYALTASYALNVPTASVSASYALTASYVENAQTASYILNAISSSYSTNADTASYVETAQTASFVLNAISASLAQTASYVVNAVSASYAVSSLSASYATSASQTISSSYAVSSSFASNAGLLNGQQASTFATTGSNFFQGNQEFTGSIWVSGNLTVYGTSSLSNITASVVDIGTNTVVLNTATPAVRFGGVSVQDSGSGAGASGSLWWDSQNNTWLYQQPASASEGYASARLISGPQNTGSLGNEIGITVGRVTFAVGDDHISGSEISINGTTAAINYDTQITGSLVVSQGITGSLLGTATTASYVLNAISSSYIATASIAISSSYALSSSYAVSASYTVSASYAATSSYLNPVINSFVILTQVSQSLNFTDDTTAAAGGVPLGGLYRNGNFVVIRIV